MERTDLEEHTHTHNLLTNSILYQISGRQKGASFQSFSRRRVTLIFQLTSNPLHSSPQSSLFEVLLSLLLWLLGLNESNPPWSYELVNWRPSLRPRPRPLNIDIKKNCYLCQTLMPNSAALRPKGYFVVCLLNILGVERTINKIISQKNQGGINPRGILWHFLTHYSNVVG